MRPTPPAPTVTQVRFTSSLPHECWAGLLGWVTFLMNGVFMDGVAVRRTWEGRLTLSFPIHKHRNGREHHCFRPTNDPTRLAIERQVFAAIAAQLEAAG
jgi:hypothetical protein